MRAHCEAQCICHDNSRGVFSGIPCLPRIAVSRDVTRAGRECCPVRSELWAVQCYVAPNRRCFRSCTLRALPLAIAFCGVLLLDMLGRRIPAPKVIGAFALFLLSLVVFAFYQYGLSGTLTGGVFPVYDLSLGRLPERLGMQLFGVRRRPYCVFPRVPRRLRGLATGCASSEPTFDICLGPFVVVRRHVYLVGGG